MLFETRLTRRIASGALVLLGTWLILCALIGVFAIEGALHPGRRVLTAGDRARGLELAVEENAVLTDVSIAAADGVVLRAWRIVPNRPNGDGVVLLHGQGDDRAGMLGPAGLLLRHGYQVLMPDARAHGESGGPIATYGVLEADDIRRWFEWLRADLHPRCIDGIGDSMGAAELLRSLDVEPGFCAVVAESSFASFREAAYVRLGQWFGTGPWLGRTVLRPAVEFGFLYARWRYGVDLATASPMRAVAGTNTPVLLIHGLADQNMPAWNSEQIKLGDASAELWEPVNADHCGASSANPAGYEARVVGFLAAHDRGWQR